MIDTNVWISAFAFSRPGSVPGRVLERVVLEDTLATCAQLSEEVYRVLLETCKWSAERASAKLAEFEERAIFVRLKHNVHVCRDPKDDMFLECAALAGADLLVTGDKDLLSLGNYGGTRIVTPLEYVELRV